ncbi:MAG TPA: hypothetical protein VG498_18640, partial [Terriglobales bacterium]|nr:hypothetical protein [Terriglobales bacterium]
GDEGNGAAGADFALLHCGIQCCCHVGQIRAIASVVVQFELPRSRNRTLFVKSSDMAKDKPKREKKKPKKAKAAKLDFTQNALRIVGEATEKN